MATRAELILLRARDMLADPFPGQRYDDLLLMRILDEGQKDFCRESQLLEGRVDVPLEVGSAYFELPSDCWLITRVNYRDRSLPFRTHNQLDNMDPPSWRTDFGLYPGTDWYKNTGRPLALVYDKRNLLECRVYPIPDSTILDTPYTLDSPFGVLGDISDHTIDPYGVLSGFEDVDIDIELLLPSEGVTESIVEGENSLKIFYVRNPKTIVSTTDELDIPEMYDTAMKNWVIGKAFLHDTDAKYAEKASSHLKMYDRILKTASYTEEVDGIRSGGMTTDYRSF